MAHAPRNMTEVASALCPSAVMPSKPPRITIAVLM